MRPQDKVTKATKIIAALSIKAEEGKTLANTASLQPEDKVIQASRLISALSLKTDVASAHDKIRKNYGLGGRYTFSSEDEEIKTKTLKAAAPQLIKRFRKIANFLFNGEPAWQWKLVVNDDKKTGEVYGAGVVCVLSDSPSPQYKHTESAILDLKRMKIVTALLKKTRAELIGKGIYVETGYVELNRSSKGIQVTFPIHMSDLA